VSEVKIDAHQHFWKYSETEYGWIDDQMSLIRRDFLPSDLETEIRKAGIDGVVSVQARQTLQETLWLLTLAAQNDFIKGVIGWVPLTKPSIRDELDPLRRDPLLRGVRHVVQDEPEGYLLRKDFNSGVSVLREMGLVYDLLIHEHQLPEAIRFVDQHPHQIFVLDHLAKPRVKANRLDPWRRRIRDLARRENVYCKISGLVTEADFKTWTEAQLQPYLETVLEAFGPTRLMFGTDWPVCLVACPYGRWYDVVSRFAASLSPEEQASLFGRTAASAYGIPWPG
jgi:L-fuconolactonase